MLGSVFLRAAILCAGYLLPAYECFKIVERSRPDTEQLRFWCQYWMIIAVVTVAERILDIFVAWLPLYNEAKLAFIVYLWYPKTKGTTYIYKTFVHPFVTRHEPVIDRHLNEFRTRASDMAVHYFQVVCNYAHARMVEFLSYAASHAPNAHSQPEYTAPLRASVVEEEEDNEFDDYDVVDEAYRTSTPSSATEAPRNAYSTRLRSRSGRSE